MGTKSLSKSGKIFPSGSGVKNPPAMQVPQETKVPSLGGEDPLEEGMATHSRILAWRVPWTEEPDGLQSMGSQRVGHDWTDWADIAHTKLYMCKRRPFTWLEKGDSLHMHTQRHILTTLCWVGNRSWESQPGLIILLSEALEGERIRRYIATCSSRGRISWRRKGDFLKKWRNLRSGLSRSWKRCAPLKAH